MQLFKHLANGFKGNLDMNMTQNQTAVSIVSRTIITALIFLGTIDTFAFPSERIFAFQLATQPFSTTMCKRIHPIENIHIPIANHRDLVLRKMPNQFIPPQFEEARKKAYVHHLMFQDLTNGKMAYGSIAFNSKHAVIFSDQHPQGISRHEFVAQVPTPLVAMANQALDTFLRLHPILNAAIDGCRPYPSQVTYGTDDEFDKILAGRLRYRDLARAYNTHTKTFTITTGHERGTSGGFYDPRSQGKRVSYQAANPLNFFRPFEHLAVGRPR